MMTLVSRTRTAICAFIAVALGLAWAGTGAHAAALSDRLGVTTDWGQYQFTSKDFMTESADEIASTGSHVIKVWLSPDTRYAYAPNSTWPAYTNMVDTVKVSYFANLLGRSEFHTYILEALPSDSTTAGECPNWNTYTGSSADYNSVWAAFYNLTAYLMQTYKNTGKTFILQNWESDNAAQLYSLPFSNSANAQKLAWWLNARQDGITYAMNQLKSTCPNVNVYGAAEVNYIGSRNSSDSWAIDSVVPQTHMDLYSYSCYRYDTGDNPSTVTANLNFIKSQAPDSATFGANNIYVGEFGSPEAGPNAPPSANDTTQYNTTYALASTMLNWGALYAVYWQVYDNEHNSSGPQGYNGYWLRKPDGTRPPVWWLIHDTCANNKFDWDPNAWYSFLSVKSGDALDNGGSTSNGTPLTQWSRIAGNYNQHWRIQYLGNGLYDLIDRTSGEAADNGGSTTAGTTVTQYAVSSSNVNQQWKIQWISGSNFNIVSQKSGMALDNGGSISNGTNVTQYTLTSGNVNQQWQIVTAN